MQDFRKLDVWKRAHRLTLDLYRLTERFPRGEIFGLTSQIRRAAASIGANLAEGCGRTQLEFAKFIQIALGSASEVEYHLLLARDLGFLEASAYEHASREASGIKRMLCSLQKIIRTDNSARASAPH
jgi:four helix bundle protein